MSIFSSKNLITAGAVILVLVAAYFGYQSLTGSKSSPTPGVTTVGADGLPVDPNAIVDSDSARFLALLESVKDIDKTINEQFIHDKYYVSLQDYTVPVPSRPLSRANPFLNIGLGGALILSNTGAGSGSLNLNFSTASSSGSVNSVPVGGGKSLPASLLPKDSGSNLSPAAQQDLLKALQQQ
jgi:hypothetical protein